MYLYVRIVLLVPTQLQVLVPVPCVLPVNTVMKRVYPHAKLVREENMVVLEGPHQLTFAVLAVSILLIGPKTVIIRSPAHQNVFPLVHRDPIMSQGSILVSTVQSVSIHLFRIKLNVRTVLRERSILILDLQLVALYVLLVLIQVE